ncbi:MAG: hypothetical protein IKY66_04705 [Bacteroidales bacterium]|nr:hypothetical protein [Bacteroidales bacterium]
MKRILTILPAISIVMISCQQNLTPDTPEIPAPADEVMTKSLSAGKVGPDDPIVFLSPLETDFWAQTISLEDRFKAFEVPASRLSTMTTEAIAKSILNYPLNYLVFAYDPNDAVDLIIKNSPLHQEFLSRTDAFEVLVDLYAASGLDMRIEKSNYDGDYVNLSYTNTMFVEAFLGANVLNTFAKSSVNQKLAETVATKLQSRIQQPETFSISSIEPLLTIDKAVGLNVASVETRADTYNYISVYTPWAQEIIGRVYTADGTATEIAQWTTQATSAYPDAIVRGPATRMYNSHSYTWHNQSTSNNIWIDYNFLNEPQLDKYWTNDKYTKDVPPAEAEKVCYTDHVNSAIILSNGKHLSKWEKMPLMEHYPNECPYILGSSATYCEGGSDRLSLTVSGQTSVINGRTYQFNVYGSLADVDLVWEVRFMDAPSPTPFVLQVFSDGRYSNIRFDDYGYYKVIVRGYRNGIEMAYGQAEVLCLP